MQYMEINFHLFVHNVMSITSTIVLLGVGISTFLNGRGQTVNKALSLALFAAATFTISHVIGTNIIDPELSRTVLMFNLSVFFIGAFCLHATLAYLGEERKKRRLILFAYSAAIACSVLFIIFPDYFLLPSVAKMYFPNYYNPGALNWIRILFMFGGVVPYIFYKILMVYLREKDLSRKKRHLYFFVSISAGFAVGIVPNFLVYNIPVDPLWGMAFGVALGIPFIYGAIKYQIFNIQVVAKQAIIYSIAVAVLGGFVLLLNYFNQLLRAEYPGFPAWVAVLLPSMLVVTASVLVWWRLRESDILKYEFIDIITHKFRTPMTHIKFSVDEIRLNPSKEKIKAAVDRIDIANNRLIELMDMLVETSQKDKGEYAYQKTSVDLNHLIEEALYVHHADIAVKKIRVNKELAPDLALISVDAERTKSVLQILIENAVMYSSAGGALAIQTRNQGNEVICSVHDEGIGISPDEMRLIFNKFYRSPRSTVIDTEGAGMGLFIAKNIVERQGGKLWMTSPGANFGSTFFICFPIAHGKGLEKHN